MKEVINIACLMFLLTGCIGSGDISSVKDNGEGYFPSMVGINLHEKRKQYQVHLTENTTF